MLRSSKLRTEQEVVKKVLMRDSSIFNERAVCKPSVDCPIASFFSSIAVVILAKCYSVAEAGTTLVESR